MAHWRDEYSAALAARDRREKANITIYDAYTKLADRTAHSTTSSTHQTPTQTPVPGTASPSPDPNKSPKSAQEQHSPQDILASTRADLIEAQRSRSELQNQLARATSDLEKERKKNNQDARRMNALGSGVTQLQLRLKDREEELKGKAKLLDDFQDELASLNLQLNMAEERTQRLQKENQELVDRWMARMGKEAEAMNDASKFS